MIIYVDVDETICTTETGMSYRLARPLLDNIEKINKLFDDGHQIVYWTARGTASGIDWKTLTKNQLDKWNVKYHQIIFGKPAYDVLIDDKSIQVEEIEKELGI